MSSGRDESFERYLRAAIALQYMQEKVSNVNFHVPHLALIGMQSAGKTRMLSYFAGRKIGGAEKSQTGTRCPVVYEFQVGTDAARFGTKDRMEDIEPRKIHEKVSAHMRNLETRGFDEEPIFVKLSGPTSLNAVIVDLPGVIPKGIENADTVNLPIGKMIKQYVNDPSTIPLVISSIPINLDMTYLSNDLSQLLFYCCDDMEAMKSLTRRALLLVSRLDTINRTMRTANLHEFIAKVEKEFGFNPDRVIFLSLMPELLDANTNEPLVDASTATYDEMTQYFNSTAPAVEQELLPQFLRSLNINPKEFNFSVGKCKAEIEVTLVSAMRSNMESAFEKMREEWRTIGKQHNELRYSVDDSTFKERVREYVELATDMLSGTATNDSSRITTSMQKAYQRHSDSTITLEDETFGEELITRLSRSFDEERTIVSNLVTDISSIAFLYEPSMLAELRSANNGKTYRFIENLAGKFSGDTGIWRVVSLFGFAIMTRPLKSFTADEVINRGNFTDNNGTRGFTTANALRKMVFDLRVKASWFKILIEWCTVIYTMQGPPVCEELRRRVKLLQSYPKLMDYLDQLLSTEYTETLKRAAKRMEEDAASIVSHRFETLKLDELTACINLLGCCGLTRSLLQPTGPIDLKQRKAAERAETIHEMTEFFDKILPGATPPPIRAAMELVKRVVERPVDHLQHTFDFFADVVQVSAHDFAALEGLKLLDLTREEVRDNIDEINRSAHMLARYSCGMAFQEVATMIENQLVRMAQQMHHQIRLNVMNKVNRLLDDPRFEAQLWQLKNEDTTIDRKRLLLERIKTWLDAASKLNDCKGNSLPLNVAKGEQRAAELQHEMEFDKRKREEIANRLVVIPPTTGQDSDDSDDDSVDGSLGGVDSYEDNLDNESRSRRMIERLERENKRLRRRNITLENQLREQNRYNPVVEIPLKQMDST